MYGTLGAFLAASGNKRSPPMQSRPPSLRQFWSPSEVAEILGTHRTTVYRWAKSGVLPPLVYLTPSRAVFRRAEIDAWLADRASEREAARHRGATTHLVKVA
jgi:excisionase family DNA binding protein